MIEFNTAHLLRFVGTYERLWMHTELRLSVTGSLSPEYPNDFCVGGPVDLGESAPHCRELSHPHRGHPRPNNHIMSPGRSQSRSVRGAGKCEWAVPEKKVSRCGIYSMRVMRHSHHDGHPGTPKVRSQNLSIIPTRKHLEFSKNNLIARPRMSRVWSGWLNGPPRVRDYVPGPRW